MDATTITAIAGLVTAVASAVVTVWHLFQHRDGTVGGTPQGAPGPPASSPITPTGGPSAP